MKKECVYVQGNENSSKPCSLLFLFKRLFGITLAVILLVFVANVPVYGSTEQTTSEAPFEGSRFFEIWFHSYAVRSRPHGAAMRQFPGVNVIIYRDGVEAGRRVIDIVPGRGGLWGDGVFVRFMHWYGVYGEEYSARMEFQGEGYHYYSGRIPVYLRSDRTGVRGRLNFYVYDECPILDIVDTDPTAGIGLVIDGMKMEFDTKPVIRLARMMLPVCQVAVLLGGEVRPTEYGSIVVYYSDRRAEIGRSYYFELHDWPGRVPHSTTFQVYGSWGWTRSATGGGPFTFGRVPYNVDGVWHVSFCFFKSFFGVEVLWDEQSRNVVILQEDMVVLVDGVPVEDVSVSVHRRGVSYGLYVPFYEIASALGRVQPLEPFYFSRIQRYLDRYRVSHQDGYAYFLSGDFGQAHQEIYLKTGRNHTSIEQIDGDFYIWSFNLAETFGHRVSLGHRF